MKVKMPLVEAMLEYKKEQVYPFHTPGHKGGRGMEEILRRELGESVRMDVSLMSELDDIHEPTGCIAQAQALAAQTYGSDACFFAVNGTTQAIHAMLLAALAPGEKVLLPRNAHRSVVGGLVLGDLQAAFVYPEYCDEFGVNMQVTAGAVAKALAQDEAIKAVLLTSPNYYGAAADVREIAKVCREHNALFLVDEAHGPHLGFCSGLPPSALQCGADAVAQSTHKILGAMTQCSMLHVRKDRIDARRVADVMSLLTTTSPNYLLLASLDAARAQVQERGGEMAAAALAAAEKLRGVAGRFPGVKILTAAVCKQYGAAALDATKVTLNVGALGYTGVEAGELLRRAGVAVELVDRQNVLFLVTYADGGADYDSVLKKIDAVFAFMQRQNRPPLDAGLCAAMPRTAMALSARQAFYGKKIAVPLEQSAGMVCGEQVSFYPPGIPVLVPGEIITREIIAYCRENRSLGLPVSGPADSGLATIRVISGAGFAEL